MEQIQKDTSAVLECSNHLHSTVWGLGTELSCGLPAYVAWRAGTTTLFEHSYLVPSPIDYSKIPAQTFLFSGFISYLTGFVLRSTLVLFVCTYIFTGEKVDIHSFIFSSPWQQEFV
jgi:hypothetical protein